MSLQTKSLKSADQELDRIVDKLKSKNKEQDILLMITPASKYVNSFELHAIQSSNQSHLGLATITKAGLAHLKHSKSIQNHRVVLASRYVNLLQNEKMKHLLNCLDTKCDCKPKRGALIINSIIPNTSSAGDYFKHETPKTLTFQDSFVQTEPDVDEYLAFSLNDVYTVLKKINCSLQPSQNDIKRFFFIADKMNVSLVVRPELLWKTTGIVDMKKENVDHFLLESYLSGSSYLGCMAVTENDLISGFDLYPQLLFNTHVIEDVFEITPLPKKFVNALKNVFGFLKLELLYDALAELCFDWYKNVTYL